MMTILAIDSSTSVCSVALRRDGAALAEIVVGGRQAEALVPSVGAVLEQAGVGWPDISLIAVTVGPGSFTGLRIGLATARGLALARRLPVIGVATSDLIAHQAPPRRMLVAIDSKRTDLFVQPFDAERRPLAEIRALTPLQALEWQSGSLVVAGDAAEQFRGLRDDLDIQPIMPSAAALAALAETRHRQGGGLPAQPLYVRPPDVTLP